MSAWPVGARRTATTVMAAPTRCAMAGAVSMPTTWPRVTTGFGVTGLTRAAGAPVACMRSGRAVAAHPSAVRRLTPAWRVWTMLSAMTRRSARRTRASLGCASTRPTLCRAMMRCTAMARTHARGGRVSCMPGCRAKQENSVTKTRTGAFSVSMPANARRTAATAMATSIVLSTELAATQALPAKGPPLTVSSRASLASDASPTPIVMMAIFGLPTPVGQRMSASAQRVHQTIGTATTMQAMAASRTRRMATGLAARSSVTAEAGSLSS